MADSQPERVGSPSEAGAERMRGELALEATQAPRAHILAPESSLRGAGKCPQRGRAHAIANAGTVLPHNVDSDGTAFATVGSNSSGSEDYSSAAPSGEHLVLSP